MPGRFEAADDLERALTRVGELLEAEGEPWDIVIVGGAALNLLGIVARPTVDVDVLALGKPGRSHRVEQPPDALPSSLARAIRTVARDMRLPEDTPRATTSARTAATSGISWH